MKITNTQRLFIVITSFILNKQFLFWLIRSKGFANSLIFFTLVVLNFMILANSLDKFIDTFEKVKKDKQKLVLKR